MRTFLDPSALFRMASRIASAIPHEHTRLRFAQLVARRLLADPRVALPADADEIAAAPDWARAAAGSGLGLYVFTPDPAAIAELRRAARAVRDAWFEWRDLDDAAPPPGRDRMILHIARELFAKAGRMQFEVLIEKARFIAGERRRRLRMALADEPLFPAEEIPAPPLGVWRRILSPAELARVGAEMRNCLGPRSTRHASYAKKLERGLASFWVLRDAAGLAQAAAMLDIAAARVAEARDRRNVEIKPGDPALAALLRARAAAYDPAPAAPMPAARRWRGGMVVGDVIMVGADPEPISAEPQGALRS